MAVLAILGPTVAWLMANGPALIAAGINIYDLVTKLRSVLDENKVVGDPEWDALESNIVALQAGALRDKSRDA